MVLAWKKGWRRRKRQKMPCCWMCARRRNMPRAICPGSVNLPLDRIETIAIAPSRPLFVYCRSGARSAQACSILKRRGYDARNIGGVLGYRGRLERGTEE